MNDKKTINISENTHTVDDIILALKKCKESSKFKLQICIDENKTYEDTAEYKLMQLCSELYECLIDARKCINVCVHSENKNKENSIYYDHRIGANGGARALLKDVDKLLNSYYKKLVQIDIAS